MKLQISKLDAARRQLETAVTLYFSGGDPVSTHTLTAAAHGVLADVSISVESGSQMLMDAILEYVKPEYRDEMRRKTREAQNFFKHAAKDHQNVLTTFDPEQTEMLMIDACLAYRRLTQERIPVLSVFEAWSWLTWAKEWLSYGVPGDQPSIDPNWKARMASKNRMEFFLEALPAAYVSVTSAAGTPK